MHQKSGQPERIDEGRGEALSEAQRDEARLARQEAEGLGREDLLAQALARGNLFKAGKRVKANRASHDLNYSNRPVRTRMPGGVGGERSGIPIAPIPITPPSVLIAV